MQNWPIFLDFPIENNFHRCYLCSHGICSSQMCWANFWDGRAWKTSPVIPCLKLCHSVKCGILKKKIIYKIIAWDSPENQSVHWNWNQLPLTKLKERTWLYCFEVRYCDVCIGFRTSKIFHSNVCASVSFLIIIIILKCLQHYFNLLCDFWQASFLF